MLEKDTFKDDLIMNCGCIFTMTHFFNSGFQDATADEHLKARYNLEPGMRTDDYHQDFNRLTKLMDQYRPKRFCYLHTEQSLSTIKNNVREWYDKNKKKKPGGKKKNVL